MSTSEEVRVIARDLTWFTFGGACVGIAFGIAMQLTLRWLQARSMPAALEVALTLPGAYMSYYLSQVTNMHACNKYVQTALDPVQADQVPAWLRLQHASFVQLDKTTSKTS